MKCTHELEYYVRRTARRQFWFEVSKFAGKAEPLAVYTIKLYPNRRPMCDCIAGSVRKDVECKHIPMVRAFLEAGEPVPYQVPWKA